MRRCEFGVQRLVWLTTDGASAGTRSPHHPASRASAAYCGWVAR